MIEESGELVVWVSVEGYSCPLADDLHLGPEWSGVLLAGIRVDVVLFLLCFLIDFLDLALDLVELFALEPSICPVLVSDSTFRTGTDRLEHVLCRIGVGWAMSALTSKVLSNDVCKRSSQLCNSIFRWRNLRESLPMSPK